MANGLYDFNTRFGNVISQNPGQWASLTALGGPGTFGSALQRAGLAYRQGLLLDQRERERQRQIEEEKEEKEREKREREFFRDFGQANAPRIPAAPVPRREGPHPGLQPALTRLTQEGQQIAGNDIGAELFGRQAFNRQFGQAGGQYGTTAHWGYDKQGNWVPFQLSTKGDPRLINVPGITPVPPGDVAAARAQGQKFGGSQGEALATFESMKSKLPGLQLVVQQLRSLANTATYTFGGQAWNFARRQVGAEPTSAAVAREQYISIVNNQILPLLRDTFGAQFTEREGNTLKATLGDADKSPLEKQAILDAFIAQKYRDIEALAARTGQEPPARTAPSDDDPAGLRK